MCASLRRTDSECAVLRPEISPSDQSGSPAIHYLAYQLGIPEPGTLEN